MEYPVTFDDFKSRYPQLIIAAQGIDSIAGGAESLFNNAAEEYTAFNGEELVILAFCKPDQATPEQAASATYTNSLALASLVAGYIRQCNVENEFVPGYDGEDAGNNETSIQGLHNTMFSANLAQNSFGRKFLNIVYRTGIDVRLAAM